MRKPLRHHLHDYFLPHARNEYHPHLFRGLSVAALAIVIIALEAGYFTQTKYVFLKTNFLASVLPGVLVELTNQDRAAYGLTGVSEDPFLSKAAQAAAEDMATRGYFSHVSPDGKDPWYWLNHVGYPYRFAGENRAVHFTDSSAVQSAWMTSPTHRANILKREYTRVGFGTANGVFEGRETTFVVEFFASPADTELASSQRDESEEQAPRIASVTGDVLGSQVEKGGGVMGPSWFVQAASSPSRVVTAVLAILFALVASALLATLLMQTRVRHSRVLVAGAFLLALIGTASLVSMGLSGSLKLAPGTQVAAVGAALSD